MCLQQPQPGRGHTWFPASQGVGLVQDAAPPSSNLIVIQTLPMEGENTEPMPSSHLSSTSQHLPRPQHQSTSHLSSTAQHLARPQPQSTASPSILLRPQDKWQSNEMTQPHSKRMLTDAYSLCPLPLCSVLLRVETPGQIPKTNGFYC